MTACYVFDIDGTIADLSHRLHHIEKEPKDWDGFFAGVHKDAPISHIIDLARALASAAHVIYVSGRSDQCRHQTAQWLDLHKLPVGHLYMRKAGDHRPDNQIKLDLLKELRSDGFEPIMAFDDRNQVVDMWRTAGIPCAQVAAGDF